jgi:hypothetical protein
MNRKGLSSLVTGVLFVLMILILVAVIWFFVKPFILETASVSSAQDCILLETSPSKCTYSDARVQPTDPPSWFVVVRAHRGADNAINVSEIKLVFSNITYTQPTRTLAWNTQTAGQSLPNPYETTEAAFNIGDFVPANVAVAAFVNKDKRSCNLSPELPCQKYQYNHDGCSDVNGDDFPNGNDLDTYSMCYSNMSKGLSCIGQWNPSTSAYDLPLSKTRFDINKDGSVNLDDFNAFNEAFLAGDNVNCA